MFEFIHSLWALIDVRARRGVCLLGGCLIVGSILESLGIALFVPLILVVVDNERALQLPLLPDLFRLADVHTPSERIVFLAGALALLYAIKNVVLSGAIWLQILIPQKTLAHLSRNLMRAYMTRAYEQHLTQNTSEVLRNFTTSLAVLIEHGIRGIMTLVMESVLVIAAISVTIVIEPAASVLVVMTVGVTMAGVLYFVRRKIGQWSTDAQIFAARQLKEITESLDAFREIKLSGLSDKRAERLFDLVSEAAPVKALIGFSGQIPRMTGEVAIIVAAFFVIVYLVVGLDLPPEATLATLGVFGAAAIRILPAASRIIEATANLRRCTVVLKMIKDDLKDQRSTERRKNRSANANRNPSFSQLQLENISYRYPNAVRDSLTNISLTIPNGDLICLAGPSGAGKSTLADLVLGLLEPTRGTVQADGSNIQDNIEEWWPVVGYVPQTVVVTDESLRENIVFERTDNGYADERVAEACELAQLTSLVDNLPDGIDTRMGERGTWVSGGQRQRIGIARALFGRPDLLVMDEATSAIDGQTSRAIMSEIRALSGKRTVIVIAHNRDVIMACNRVLFLVDGALIADGKYETLLQTSDVFRSFMAGLEDQDDYIKSSSPTLQSVNDAS